MWLLTPEGFFSTTCKKDDPDTIQIRARREEHIKYLLERCEGQEGLRREIHKNVGTDYQYRVYVSKKVFADWLKHIGETIDYDNFKSKAEFSMQDKGVDNSDYEDLLHEIWHLGYNSLREDR